MVDKMAEEEEKEIKKESLLIPREKYLEAGVHIGTRFKTIDMKPFIFKMRDDGLFILDLRKVDERIRMAAKMMTKYKPEEVLVVASRLYSGNAAQKFSDLTGVRINRGRFVPGSMTNIALPTFVEPKLLFVCDPKGEGGAVREASKVGVPVIALCDTDNGTGFMDLVVPSNNKGRKALALVFYLLSRELMMSQGKIKSYDEFEPTIEYFERFEEEKKKPTVEKAPKEEEVKKAAEKKGEKAKEEPKKEEKPPEKPKEKEEKPKEGVKEEKPAEKLKGEGKVEKTEEKK